MYWIIQILFFIWDKYVKVGARIRAVYSDRKYVGIYSIRCSRSCSIFWCNKIARPTKESTRPIAIISFWFRLDCGFGQEWRRFSSSGIIRKWISSGNILKQLLINQERNTASNINVRIAQKEDAEARASSLFIAESTPASLANHQITAGFGEMISSDLKINAPVQQAQPAF